MASEGEASLPLELLESGDPAFVDAIRQVNDAEALSGFANDWYNDRRPSSRSLLLDYLDRPLNAFRHEGLVKRLFKRAEAEGDDPVMARFLVLFDRSIRRYIHKRRFWESQDVATEDEGEACQARWAALGYTTIHVLRMWNGGFVVQGRRTEESIRQPRQTTMPRGRMVDDRRFWIGLDREPVPDWASLLDINWKVQLKKADIRQLPHLLKLLTRYRLFSVATRQYLRRRAWRYFRNLGKTNPDRYVAAASEALALYRDEDVADGLALIDNWGLVHILFHDSPALESRPSGWTIKAGHSLAELSPAPSFEALWKAAPGAVLGLMSNARSQTVRRWAIRRIEADPALHGPGLPLDEWLQLLGHDDPEVVALAAEVLDRMEGLETVSVDRWLALAESTHPAAIDAICQLIARFVRPEQVTLAQAVRLAGLRPLPVARLGFSWLKAMKLDGPADLRTVLGLVDAESEPLRPEILRWLRGVLTASSDLDASMVLEFLDSRHADVRAEGWNWFQSEPRVRDDVETWRKLLESPYDDIRLALVAELESRVSGESLNLSRNLDPEVLRQLWAGVLLNVHRGGRAKPTVVGQILRRLEANPGDAPALLPLLGVAMRSIRGPERRAGLVAVVKLLEGRAEVEPLIRSSFPELQFA
jgi:hypothetical protein